MAPAGGPSALETSERRYRAIAEQAFEPLMIVDADHVLRWANPAFERLLGYRLESLTGTGVIPLIHPADHASLLATVGRLTRTPGSSAMLTLRMRASDGSWRLLDSSATNLVADPAVGGFVVSLRDVTERARVASALHASEERYRELVERAPDGIYTADLDGRLTSVNPGAERITGYSRDELLRLSLFDLIVPEDQERAADVIARASGGGDVTTELQVLAKDGRRLFVQVSGRVVSENGIPGHIERIARDTTERHMLEDQLRHEATHDELTGLPNRTLFMDRLEQALARSARTHSEIAVMLLDVDDFKFVNDSLGHAVGDEVLVELASRLRGLLRSGETVARLGGDEFGLVAEGFAARQEVVAVAERVSAAFTEPFTTGGTERRLTGSLGIVVATAGDDPSDLLRDVDTAMYRVKATDKGAFAFFDAASRAQLLRHVALSKALDQALRDRAVEVHFQPIVSLRDGQILAVEALTRWRHRQWGWLRPSEFIPLAEENGLIGPLGEYVLDEALRRFAQWRAPAPECLPLGLFVNVSPRELSHELFVPSVLEALRRHGLHASDLAFELTERVLIEDENMTVGRSLTDLAKNGIRLVLDDFGTGYSSLASLRRFPLTALKIDRFFINAIDSPEHDAAITRAVIGLGNALGMIVIGEGVETAVQLDYLRRLGCTAAQGYLLGRPQPAARIAALLATAGSPERTAVGTGRCAPGSDAPIPDDDEARLSALRGYDVLDSEPEPEFDDLARLAAEICETPLAFVSLVDREREFFKAAVGSDAREAPRDTSFCGHAIVEDGPFVIEDTRADARFEHNPQVLGDAKVRFYAGVPLTTADGYTIGTLCVKDTRPRKLSATQLRALATLGRQVVAQLELRRMLLPVRRVGNTSDRGRRRAVALRHKNP